jgi:hypothetical protein
MLEVDICDSVDAAPTLPAYDTHSHPNRPTDLPRRTLTIEESYLEAGIDLSLNPSHTIIDDSAAEFDRWSPDELHDAMEGHFSRYPGTWPKWHMWCLLAGTFDSPSVGGIMFDAAAAYGGAGDAPDRQGCAVFRDHSWFNDLVPNPPGNDTQAAAMRKFLYTYVHEIGHAFNFLHSWDKGRPDALSWMNYDWKYDNRHVSGAFWGDFYKRFDDEELIHMRHGDRSSVIMGGDPWASGGHLEAPVGAMSDLVGESPVELLLRSKGTFQFMEPIQIELRLRNLTDLPLELDSRLEPEFGGVLLYIRRPNGRILQFAPVLCKLATPKVEVLLPLTEGKKGIDRYSENVSLSYGAAGFYFDEPGEYQIRAIYQGGGELQVPSNLHRIRVTRPATLEEDRIAQDFFTYKAGMALYLNGSSSPSLENGMQTLETMADQFKASAVGAQMSLVLAENLKRSFFRIEKDKVVKARSADPEGALALTSQALEQQKQDETTFTNLSYHHLVRTRADLMVAMDKASDAKKELDALVGSLADKGVNQPVLDDIQAYAESI